jgi:hypothetical protein
MLVRGAEPMEKRQQRGLFTVLALLAFAHMFFLRYPLILWITVYRL